MQSVEKSVKCQVAHPKTLCPGRDMVQLAEELLEAIFYHVFHVAEEELMRVVPAPRKASSIALASKAFNRICTPHLYYTVVLATESHSDNFLRTLEASPTHASLVKVIAIDGAFQSYLRIAEHLAQSAQVHTVSMNVLCFSGTEPQDALALPNAAPYLGSTVVALKPHTVIVANTRSDPATETMLRTARVDVLRHPEYEVRRARGRIVWEMVRWTETRHVHLNLLMRLLYFSVKDAVNGKFTSLSLRLDFGQDEREALRTLVSKWQIERINIAPHGNSMTFLPEYLHELSKDAELRKRVHLERDTTSFKEQLRMLRQGTSKTPFAVAASTGRRWEL